MAVFICWSGDRSQAIAEALKTLLSRNIPQLAPRSKSGAIFLSMDIDKGVEWFQAVGQGLGQAKAVIVVLTAENVDSPWIHFEAGALARRIEANPPAEAATPAQPAAPTIFPLLHGIAAAQLRGPLAAYQATTTTRSDMDRLVGAVSAALGTRHSAPISEEAWRPFQDTLDLAAVPMATLIGDLYSLFHRKTFNEPFHHCPDQDWLERYNGVRVTLDRLRQKRSLVQVACAGHERGLFEMLLSDLDAYAMTIHSLLLTPKHFGMAADGALEMDDATRTCCEDRRLAIKSISMRLLHPLEPPLTSAAVRFMAAETHEERRLIVHRLEGRIRREREIAYGRVLEGLGRDQADREALTVLMHDSSRRRSASTVRGTGARDASHDPYDGSESEPALQCPQPESLLVFRASSWDLDRIFYYRLVLYFETAAFSWPKAARLAASPSGRPLAAPEGHDLLCLARDIEMETERYRARAKGASLMPLACALEALRGLHPFESPTEDVRGLVARAIDMVQRELHEVLPPEAARAIEALTEQQTGRDGDGPGPTNEPVPPTKSGM